MPVLLRCHKGIGPVVTGTALVASDNFSARYDLDRIKGIFSRPGHKLGRRKLCRPHSRPRSSQGRGRHRLDAARNGGETNCAARADLQPVNPILAQGAAFGNVALVDRFADGDVTSLFQTGDELRVDPAAGLVEILNRER